MRLVKAAVGLVAVLMTTACGGERADPQGKAVVEAREEARQRASDPVIAREPTLLSHIALDYCREGQYDWKIREDFLSECVLMTAKAYTFSGDFRARVAQIHTDLLASGWTDAMGTPGSLGVWDGSDEAIGRIPASLYKRDGDLRRLWVVFQSSVSPPPDPYFYPHLGTPEQVDSEKHFSTYHSTTNGTPWGTAWEAAGRPGPYLVVFKTEDVYHREPR